MVFPASYEGYETQWKQKERRREGTRETLPYLCKQQHARPWQHKHTRARQDWHAKSPWHMLARWHPVCSRLAHTTHTNKHTLTHETVTVAIEQGHRKGRGRSTWHVCAPHYKCNHIWVRGWWEGDGRCTAEDEMDTCQDSVCEEAVMELSQGELQTSLHIHTEVQS